MTRTDVSSATGRAHRFQALRPVARRSSLQVGEKMTFPNVEKCPRTEGPEIYLQSWSSLAATCVLDLFEKDCVEFAMPRKMQVRA